MPLLVFGLLALVFWPHSRSFKPSPPIDSSKVITATTDHPSEVRPPATTTWLGAANEPKYIALPSVKAGGFVVKLGLNASGALATPNNIYTAGWFTGSVLPGKSGLSVMVGHVNGPTSDQAIFSGLARLQPGDIIQLTLGNDAKLGYRVRSVRSYSVNDSVNHLFSQEPDFTRQLNLITCSGSYDRATRSYSERTIVVAEQT